MSAATNPEIKLDENLVRLIKEIFGSVIDDDESKQYFTKYNNPATLITVLEILHRITSSSLEKETIIPKIINEKDKSTKINLIKTYLDKLLSQGFKPISSKKNLIYCRQNMIMLPDLVNS